MGLELVKSLRVGKVETWEWDEERRFGVVAEATGRLITTGLLPVAFYPDEESKVYEFLEGLELARGGRADVFFVPPLPGDDGTWRNYPLMQGTMEDHKRSYVVICGEGQDRQVYCAPATAFAEDEEEDIGLFLERMGEVVGERFFVLPQELLMGEIGWERGQLDEFDREIPFIQFDLGYRTDKGGVLRLHEKKVWSSPVENPYTLAYVPQFGRRAQIPRYIGKADIAPYEP